MNTLKRFWALCLDTYMKLALYGYAIIIPCVKAIKQNKNIKESSRVYIIH